MPFKKEKSGFRHNPGKSFGGKQFGAKRPSFDRGAGGFELFPATCEKCGKRCEVPFKPTNGKPVYCRECFGKTDRNDRADTQRSVPTRSPESGSSQELAEINRKLDLIMEALEIDE